MQLFLERAARLGLGALPSSCRTNARRQEQQQQKADRLQGRRTFTARSELMSAGNVFSTPWKPLRTLENSTNGDKLDQNGFGGC